MIRSMLKSEVQVRYTENVFEECNGQVQFILTFKGACEEQVPHLLVFQKVLGEQMRWIKQLRLLITSLLSPPHSMQMNSC